MRDERQESRRSERPSMLSVQSTQHAKRLGRYFLSPAMVIRENSGLFPPKFLFVHYRSPGRISNHDGVTGGHAGKRPDVFCDLSFWETSCSLALACGCP
jgi:hypothetical protein